MCLFGVRRMMTPCISRELVWFLITRPPGPTLAKSQTEFGCVTILSDFHSISQLSSNSIVKGFKMSNIEPLEAYWTTNALSVWTVDGDRLLSITLPHEDDKFAVNQ